MNLEEIEGLLVLLKEHDVQEFSYKDEACSLKLRLGPAVVAGAQLMPSPRNINHSMP